MGTLFLIFAGQTLPTFAPFLRNLYASVQVVTQNAEMDAIATLVSHRRMYLMLDIAPFISACYNHFIPL